MVLLRDFTENDTGRLVTILNDDAVTRFLSTKIASPYTKEDALWWVTEGSKGDLVKAISVNDSLVGCIGVNRGEFEYQKSGEIGYWLAKEYWRQGIASSAIQQMTSHVYCAFICISIFR